MTVAEKFTRRCRRIALTGGPGGGKTTAADLFVHELGERVVIVPEAANLLFSGGFPRSTDPVVRRATQSAIYHVQRNLEDATMTMFPERIQLCDRGTVDGGAYWPDGPDDYFSAQGTSHDQELERYDAVIFLETAAAGGMDIEAGNPIRIESKEQALAIDRRLHQLWSSHPCLVVVPNEVSFLKKITLGLEALQSLIASL